LRAQLDWDIYNVTGTTIDANGFPSVTIDAEGEQGSIPIPVHMLHGMWSLPLDPVVDPGTGEPIPTKAAQVLVAWEGGVGHAFPITDVRLMAKLPLGVAGERIWASDFGSFIRQHKDGSITESTTTTGGGSDGQTVASRVMPTAFQRFAPWGRETFDATGYSLTHIGGASFEVAYAGGIFPGLDSYVRLTGSMIELNGAAISIGPTGVPHQPVAQAAPLVSILQSLLTTLEALITGVGAIPTVGNAAAAAAVAALPAAQSAVAGALVAISTHTAVG
jgi:hypothetical protein